MLTVQLGHGVRDSQGSQWLGDADERHWLCLSRLSPAKALRWHERLCPGCAPGQQSQGSCPLWASAGLWACPSLALQSLGCITEGKCQRNIPPLQQGTSQQEAQAAPRGKRRSARVCAAVRCIEQGGPGEPPSSIAIPPSPRGAA